MKPKIQAILAVLFIASFVKSFKYSSNGYDIVFILIVAGLFMAYEFITEQATKNELAKVKQEIDLKFKQQEEQLEVVRNNTSKMALGLGYKR